MNTAVAGKPYISLWPLPGGGGNFLDTLHKTLSWIDQHPDSTAGDAELWMRNTYSLKGSSTAPAYLGTIRTMGYLQKKNNQLVLSPAGKQFLESKDKELVLAGFLTECTGAWEVLSAVGELGVTNLKAVHNRILTQFPQWKTVSQPEWRWLWLLSLGCIEKTIGGYKITTLGAKALGQYSGPVAQGLVPSVAKKDEAAPVSSIPGPQGTTAVQGKTSTPSEEHEHATSPKHLDQLIHDLQYTAQMSEEATDFEIAISKAFSYLGFQAEHKSGPGDTDVLLIAPLGRETYRVVVDGKSSKHGKIQTGAVNWSALGKHRQMYQAAYALVVAPGFTTGDLYTYAKDSGTALLSVKDLCAILLLHYETPFSLTDLKGIFSHPGDPEHPLQQMKDKTAEVRRLQQLIPDTIRALEETGAYVHEPISAEGLYYVLAMSHKDQQYKKSEIQDALSVLASPFVGALTMSGEHSYLLEMTSETILRRLQAQVRRLEHNT